MGHITESDVKPARGFAPRFVHSCVAHLSSTEDRCWHGNGDDDGREESSLLLHPGAGTGMEAEEAARQYTAIAMILKSRAHTAARKLRRRGCYGSASSTALHDAHIIVLTLTTTQSSHSWRSGPFGEISPWLAMLTGCPDQHNGRRSAYSSTNSWASNRFNLYERSVQLTLYERL